MTNLNHRQEVILLETKFIFESQENVEFVKKIGIFLRLVFPKIEELYFEYPSEFEDISHEIHSIIFKQEIIENTSYIKNKDFDGLNKFRSAWIQILRTKSEVLKKLDDQRLFDFLIDYARLGDSWFQSNNGAAPIVKEVYKDDGYCYIATMVYGDYNHPSVIQLRNFRDNKLNKCQLGRLFIKYYYKYSPYLIKSLQDKFLINKFLTIILDIIVNKIKK